jgi:hypothetical protein
MLDNQRAELSCLRERVTLTSGTGACFENYCNHNPIGQSPTKLGKEKRQKLSGGAYIAESKARILFRSCMPAEWRHRTGES